MRYDIAFPSVTHTSASPSVSVPACLPPTVRQYAVSCSWIWSFSLSCIQRLLIMTFAAKYWLHYPNVIPDISLLPVRKMWLYNKLQFSMYFLGKTGMERQNIIFFRNCSNALSSGLNFSSCYKQLLFPYVLYNELFTIYIIMHIFNIVLRFCSVSADDDYSSNISRILDYDTVFLGYTKLPFLLHLPNLLVSLSSWASRFKTEENRSSFKTQHLYLTQFRNLQ